VPVPTGWLAAVAADQLPSWFRSATGWRRCRSVAGGLNRGGGTGEAGEGEPDGRRYHSEPSLRRSEMSDVHGCSPTAEILKPGTADQRGCDMIKQMLCLE